MSLILQSGKPGTGFAQDMGESFELVDRLEAFILLLWLCGRPGGRPFF